MMLPAVAALSPVDIVVAPDEEPAVAEVLPDVIDTLPVFPPVATAFAVFTFTAPVAPVADAPPVIDTAPPAELS